MILNITAETIAASAATEAAVGGTLAATTAAVAEPLTAALPMGADLDSLAFAAALNAAGIALISAAGAHSADREIFSATQQAAAVTYAVTDVVNNAALSL